MMVLHFLIIVSAFAIGIPLAVIAGDYLVAFLCFSVGSWWVVTADDL
jgi:hypothetical protein|tara:strand:- start:4552 stop:4692 length:141 start_codon:yes stop_codon:yes gene_type:complete